MSKVAPIQAADPHPLRSAAANEHPRVYIQAMDAVAQPSSLPQRRDTGKAWGPTTVVDEMPAALKGGGWCLFCRSKLPRRAVGLLRRHWVLLIACGSSLGLGSGLGTFLHSKRPAQVSELKRPALNADPQVVFASTRHRHEPIAPLAPFDQLDAAVVELGRRLFHERGLSSSGTVACASCHPLDAGGTLHVPLPPTSKAGTARYNAPTVFNTALNFAQSWDGGVSTLERYIDTSITAAHELDSSWERVTKFLGSAPQYRETFAKVMHGEPNPERIRTALATFQRSLVTINSKFDQWLQGTDAALDSDEFGGYFLFKKFGCITCHQGVGVGGTMFQPLGIAKAYFGNDPAPAELGRFNVTGQERDRHVFRVPPLRNVQLTAPYLHDGSIATLEKVVALMIEYQCGQEFNSEDVRRLTAFLNSLTGELPPAAAGQISGAQPERSPGSLMQSARPPLDRGRRSSENRDRPNDK